MNSESTTGLWSRLPANLQSLTLGGRYSQSLESVQLPASLKTLTLGYNFCVHLDQSLEYVQRPANLKTLTFSNNFNQSLAGVQLPASLQTLAFGSAVARTMYVYAAEEK